jgi:hypothetical protein
MGRACLVCASPRRRGVDEALASGGDTYAAIGRRFRLSADSIKRHKAAHLSPALQRVVLAQADDESAMAAFSNTLAQVQSLAGRLEALMSVAEDRQSLIGASNVARELRQCLELVAKLRGELNERPQSVTVNVLSTPEFAGMVGRLVAALAPWPDARIAAASVLDVEEVP